MTVSRQFVEVPTEIKGVFGFGSVLENYHSSS